MNPVPAPIMMITITKVKKVCMNEDKMTIEFCKLKQFCQIRFG